MNLGNAFIHYNGYILYHHQQFGISLNMFKEIFIHSITAKSLSTMVIPISSRKESNRVWQQFLDYVVSVTAATLQLRLNERPYERLRAFLKLTEKTVTSKIGIRWPARV